MHSRIEHETSFVTSGSECKILQGSTIDTSKFHIDFSKKSCELYPLIHKSCSITLTRVLLNPDISYLCKQKEAN